MSFRPFSLGDILLLQRIRRYSTRLQIERTLLESASPLRVALQSCVPWHVHNSFTFVLRQKEHGLVREGLIQLQLRPNSHEADVTLLAPALDAPQGHPAIWQKLLSQSTQHLARYRINRLFGDLPDQPLLVNTFKQAGFSLFTRVTIWRLVTAPMAWSSVHTSPVRPQQKSDGWALEQLYRRVTPASVQQLETGFAPSASGNSQRTAPILSNPYSVSMSGFVLEEGPGELAGCVQILWGQQCAWIRLWVDPNDPQMETAHLLMRHALQRIIESSTARRTYIGVREYQTGLNSLLTDYGFAPFTDRALLGRNIAQWVKQLAEKRMPALESVREAVPGSLAVPKADGNPHVWCRHSAEPEQSF